MNDKKEKIYILKYDKSKNKYAIFEKKSNKQVSDYFDDFYFDEFSYGVCEYYKAIYNYKQAIFHKSGQQVTKWFEKILNTGLLTGESKSKFVAVKDKKEGIFDIYNKDFFVGWYHRVSWQGIVNDKCSYCIAVDENFNHFIVSKENKAISPFFDWIFGYGLLEGKKDLFIGQKKDKIGIFDIKGNLKSELIKFNLANLEYLKQMLYKSF